MRRRPSTVPAPAVADRVDPGRPGEATSPPREDGGRRLESRAAAKVNLTLAVGHRRADGFHEVSSVFLRVGLSDELSVSRDARDVDDDAGDTIEVDGDPDCPVNGNLVLRSAALLRGRMAAPLPRLAFRLEKRIPVAAGLGGGSSDAAAALRLAASAWDIGLPPDELLALAALVGSDVPFFAADVAAAHVTGRGEHVQPLPAVRGDLGIVLVTPPTRLSTAAVFAAFDRLAASPAASASAITRTLAEELSRGIDAADLAHHAASLRAANALWPAATRCDPALDALRDQLEALLGRPVLLSGSGPTLFALYPSAVDAVNAARAVVARTDRLLTRAFIAATDPTGPDPAWSTR